MTDHEPTDPDLGGVPEPGYRARPRSSEIELFAGRFDPIFAAMFRLCFLVKGVYFIVLGILGCLYGILGFMWPAVAASAVSIALGVLFLRFRRRIDAWYGIVRGPHRRA